MNKRLSLAALLLFVGWAASTATACALSDISIKSSKARFVNKCSTRPCRYMTGVAVLTNRCSEAVGVEVKMIAFDKRGEPVATRQLWPASINNIPPGDFTFSLDQFLDYDPAMATFELEAVSIKQWRSTRQ